MSVRQAVSRAMRSGGVVIPGEFEAIQNEAIASLNIAQLHSGDYLFRGEDAAALRRMAFRNDEERRDFAIGLLHLARDRVLAQIAQAIEALPSEDRARSLACYGTRREGSGLRFEAAACFASGMSLGRPEDAGTGSGFSSGLQRFLQNLLPASGFIGLAEPSTPSTLTAIQLLDGVFFTVENYSAASLPRDTQVSAAMLASLYRAGLCTEGSTLPDSR
ncbi:MAG: hypothetical protein U1F66_01495 [bacterium]